MTTRWSEPVEANRAIKKLACRNIRANTFKFPPLFAGYLIKLKKNGEVKDFQGRKLRRVSGDYIQLPKSINLNY